MEINRKVFVFHGCDYKVGTTMTAQATAELIANCRKDLRILFLCLNSRESTEYCGESVENIEAIKMKADNRLLTHEDVMKICSKEGSLYVLGGVNGLLKHRHYSPDFPSAIIDIASQIFDLIIVDSGNEIDSGLAVGALKATPNRILVMAQNESILKRYEIVKEFYDILEIDFDQYVVNKYLPEDPHDEKYIRKRLGIPENKRVIFVSDQNMYARIAEMEHSTLLQYKSQEYINGISEIALSLFRISGIEGGVEIKMKKRIPFGKW